MSRSLFFALPVLALSLAAADTATAQDWRPPSRAMPTMPQASEVSPTWMAARSDWFRGAAGAVGVDASTLRITGEGRQAGGQVQVVRANAGPLPVIVWQDRNGDARADLIEIFRSGSVIIQLIDADYDGTANVLRVYDASGSLMREDRM